MTHNIGHSIVLFFWFYYNEDRDNGVDKMSIVLIIILVLVVILFTLSVGIILSQSNKKYYIDKDGNIEKENDE